MRTNILILLLFSLVSAFAFGQGQSKIDSLLFVLKLSTEDTTKVGALNEIGTLFLKANNYAAATEYADSAIRFSNRIGFKKGNANAYVLLGSIKIQQGKYSEAVENCSTALKACEEIKDKACLANAYSRLGVAYHEQDNYVEALKNHFASLKIYEEIGDKKGIARNYINIGVVFFRQKNYAEALKNYLASLKISEEINDKPGIALAYGNSGLVLDRQGNTDAALKNYSASLKIYEEMGDNRGIARNYNNIGEILSKQEKYEEALKNLLASLRIKEKIGEKRGLTISCLTIGSVYVAQKNYSSAREYFNRALALSKTIGSKEIIRDSYHWLSHLDSLTKNPAQSMVNYKLFTEYKDSILNEANLRQINELQAKYESEKKDNEIQILTKDKVIQETEIKKQKLLKNSFVGLFSLLALLALFIFYNIRIHTKLRLQNLRNKIASDLHDDIGSTINSISIFAELAKKKDDQMDEALEMIGDSASKISDSMSDIVWSINPDNDSFNKIIFRMKSTAHRLLRAKKIEYSFEADESLGEKKLSLQQRRNFYLIFKEAINNLVKYSNATMASIILSSMDEYVTMRISDNGSGFEISRNSEGNGLKNMKRRADELRAQFKIESQKGNGTYLELTLKT